MFGISVTRLVIYGVIALAVIAAGWMLRHELIEKGKNLVYAEDNAARVKAQEQQIKSDALLVAGQNDYINLLQSSGQTVKEKIRVVQAPCDKDGLGDPRLGIFDDWMRGRAGDSGAAGGGPAAKGTVPAARK